MRIAAAAALLVCVASPPTPDTASVSAFVIEWTAAATRAPGAERLPAVLLPPPLSRERWTVHQDALRRDLFTATPLFEKGTVFLYRETEALVTVVTPDNGYFVLNPERLPLPRWELVQVDARDRTHKDLLGYSSRVVRANLVLTPRGTEWSPRSGYPREIGVTAEIWSTDALPRVPALVRAALGGAGLDVPADLVNAIDFPLAVKLTMTGGFVSTLEARATSVRRTSVPRARFDTPPGARRIPNPIDQLLDRSRRPG